MVLGMWGRGAKRQKTGRQMVQALAVLLVFTTGWLTNPVELSAQELRFSTISIEGNARIGDSAVLSRAGIAPGESLTPGKLNDALQQLQNSGLFESVEVIPQGNTLRIVVVELPTINRVRFEGNRRLDDDALGEVIESEERRVFNPAQAERDASNIAEAYTQQGRIAARVSPRIIRRTDNRVDLIFEIFEGDVVEIERLSFVGNRAFSDRRLRRVLETKQAGLLRAFVRTDTLIDDRIAFDRQVLQDFYLSRGYVDFRTLSVNAELTEERDGFFLVFRVQEGQQFRFGEITTVSEIAEIDANAYQSLIKIRPGVVYSPSLLETEIARLENQSIRDGVDFVRVEPRITRIDRDLALNVEFVISRGPRVFVERIDIEGNTTTLDRVIRRQFDLAEGDPFNPRRVRQAAERIRALDFFETAEVNAREGSRPDQVVVDVDVSEKPTGTLSFGASFSRDDGVGALVTFSERNFLGRGQTLRLSFSTAEDAEAYGLQFVEPSFLGRDVAFGLQLDFQTTDSRFLTYETENLVFSPSLSFPVSENGRLQLRYRYDDIEMSSIAGETGAIIQEEVGRGDQSTSSIGYTYTYDTRRTGLNPDAGWLFEFSQDFAGLGGDNKFLRTTAKAIGQRLAFNDEVTLRASVEGGLLSWSSGNSRAVDRFSLNPRIIRGFEPGGIGPRDAGATDDALGGNMYVAARLEAEFPLGLPEEIGIRGALFYDVANLWGLDNANPANAAVVGEDGSFRHVLGFSILWDTAIGPLRFNFTEALNAKSFDKERSFDVTIRTSF